MDYPLPSIPLSPVLSWAGLRISGGTRRNICTNSILANPHLLHVSSGRAAIALALEHSGITQGDEVLIPAYHCESMVSPTQWRGASPVFYKINIDTTIDVEDIKRKLSVHTKAIIVTHYFGFIQNMPPIVDLCKQKGLILIEDCAHAFFGSRDGKHVGAWGDYAIASSMKFFPVFDGGIISSSGKDIDSTQLTKPSFFFQVKSSLNVVQAAVHYKRLGLLGAGLRFLTELADGIWHTVKKVSGRENSGIHGPSSSGGGYGLDEKWIHSQASLFSKYIIDHNRLNRIQEERRINYLKLHNALRGLPHSRPLFDELPKGIVPLVYPLYVDNPNAYFSSLKHSGVPIWRFGQFLDEAITEDMCSCSVALSDHVFQFPCHQELKDGEIDWMIAKITDLFDNQQGVGKK